MKLIKGLALGAVSVGVVWFGCRVGEELAKWSLAIWSDAEMVSEAIDEELSWTEEKRLDDEAMDFDIKEMLGQLGFSSADVEEAMPGIRALLDGVGSSTDALARSVAAHPANGTQPIDAVIDYETTPPTIAWLNDYRHHVDG